MKKIELLAPAGNMACLKAAVNAGADAIYLGGKSFSNRAFADNFSEEEFKEAIAYAHIRQVKIYVTINTMVYDNELEEILSFTDFLYLNDVDALIVTDFGLINVLKNRYVDFDIHVSTQANVSSIYQLKLYEAIGVKRVILARETSLASILKMKQETSLELEVFAHGALCVCSSGNCLHSSFIGKRSGNRGECAQPCRMEYMLTKDNKAVSNKKYLLSMKDLNTLEHISELIEAGITSLKIEGRMKNEEYVALVTKTYRDAIDRYYENKDKTVDYLANEKIKQVFSREFTSGYLFNDSNKNLVNSYRPSHLGFKVGKVIGVKDDKVQIKLSDTLSQKDKIAIVQERFEDVKMFLSKIYVKNKLVPCGYANEIIEVPVSSRILKDAVVYKMVDNKLSLEIENTILKEVKRIPLRMKFIANVGENLVLSLKDNNNHSILVKSEYVVDKALNSPTLEDKISEQLSKLTSTCYSVGSLTILIDKEGIIPIKYINDLRREAINKMDEERSTCHRRDENKINLAIDYPNFKKKENKSFAIKVHNEAQLEAIKDISGIDAIYYDDMDTFNKVAKKNPNLNLIPVLTRIIDENNKISAASYVINNYGDLVRHNDAKIITDTYMNVANKESIANLLKHNVSKITLSSELNRNQIKNLICDFNDTYGFIPSLEMVAYGHLQTMVTSFCPIAKEYGFDKKHCNTCRQQNFGLLDRMNYVFPITTDHNCNVTIYNSKALHLIDYIDEIYNMGVTTIRLDFSIEKPDEVKNIVLDYLNVISGDYSTLHLNDVTYGYYLD